MKIHIVLFLIAVITLQACNLPSGAPPTNLPVEILSTPSVPGVVESPIPTLALAVTDTPTPTATPQNPLVLRDTLCWIGPGNKYDVVSALKTGTRLELIGRGTLDGWWVISNPIYKDACWVQANDVQIEPGFDTSTLKLIDPPPLPTPTWTPSITPTPHP